MASHLLKIALLLTALSSAKVLKCKTKFRKDPWVYCSKFSTDGGEAPAVTISSGFGREWTGFEEEEKKKKGKGKKKEKPKEIFFEFGVYNEENWFELLDKEAKAPKEDKLTCEDRRDMAN
jgi:hypothetical protein